MSMRYLFGIFLLATLAAGADDYTGPRPPKPDVLYLVHASNLVPTEVAEAQQEGKNNDTFSVSGAASSARTPLSEPIFLLRSEKIKPDSLELYRFDVKSGRRQLTLSRKRSDKSGPFHLSITKLDKDLYRVEADEALEDGEYSLSPSGSNAVFCFQIY